MRCLAIWLCQCIVLQTSSTLPPELNEMQGWCIFACHSLTRDFVLQFYVKHVKRYIPIFLLVLVSNSISSYISLLRLPQLDQQSEWQTILGVSIATTIVALTMVVSRVWPRRQAMKAEEWIIVSTMVRWIAKHYQSSG